VVCRSGVATYRKGAVIILHHKNRRIVENWIVPLARDGKTVDIVVACSVLYDRDGQEN
jgi:hypothetical protein